jgi:hypothetical protein
MPPDGANEEVRPPLKLAAGRDTDIEDGMEAIRGALKFAERAGEKVGAGLPIVGCIMADDVGRA